MDWVHSLKNCSRLSNIKLPWFINPTGPIAGYHSVAVAAAIINHQLTIFVNFAYDRRFNNSIRWIDDIHSHRSRVSTVLPAEDIEGANNRTEMRGNSNRRQEIHFTYWAPKCVKYSITRRLVFVSWVYNISIYFPYNEFCYSEQTAASALTAVSWGIFKTYM